MGKTILGIKNNNYLQKNICLYVHNGYTSKSNMFIVKSELNLAQTP